MVFGRIIRCWLWEDELSAAVMRAVHGHALAAVDGDGAMKGVVAYRHDRRAELACRLESVKGRIEHNGDLRLRMYSGYAAGVIDKAQYGELIDRVLVGEGGDIEVVFRFGDPVAACASKQEGAA